jgi:flagellar biosynthesis/type III secretory pathway chaperone
MIQSNRPTPPAEQDIMEGLAINLTLSRELLSTLQEESIALRAMDTQGLFRLSRQKETLLAKIHYLDASLRPALTAEGNPQTPPLHTPEQRQRIDQYRTKIKALRQEIQTKNIINKRFTEDTLGYLKDAIALITRPAEADHTYRIPGRSQPRGKTLPSFISRGV